MWKRLTVRARKSIFLAQKEAEKLGYAQAGPEHLLLALTREDECVAGKILRRLGIDSGTIRQEVMRQISRGSECIGDSMQLTVSAKHALDYAFAEAREMMDEWVGTEHMLLGLAHETGGMGSIVLGNLGLDLMQIREALRKIKAGTLPFEGQPDRSSCEVPAAAK